MPYFHNVSPRITVAFVRARSCGDYYPGRLHAARYYGVILYLKIKATSFRVRAQDYDSRNKPISIGRHNGRASPENFNVTLYTKKKGAPAPSFSRPSFYPRPRASKTVRRICERSREETIIAPGIPARSPACLPICLRSPRTRRRPPAGSLA